MGIYKKKKPELSGNQDGSVLLIALMIMMVITLIGMASLNLTATDLKITQNDRCYKQNLFKAEAAAFEAGQIMEDDTGSDVNLKPETTAFNWLDDGADFDPANGDWTDQNTSYSTLYDEEQSGYAAVFEGVSTGASLDMSNATQLWQYRVYGRSEQCGGRVDMVMGYRKRF